MAKTQTTRMLEKLLSEHFNRFSEFFVFECTYGWAGKEIVDAIMYNNEREVSCYEIKQSKSDFNSKAKLSFFGNKNYFVMPYELYEQVKNDIYNNYKHVGVYVPCKIPRYGDNDRVYDVYEMLYCIKPARRQELQADKEVILSSMLRSMQRDRLYSLPLEKEVE